MTQDEILGLLNYTRKTAHGFYIEPGAAVKSWHKALGGYSGIEAMDAVDYIVANSRVVPEVSLIRARCEQVRHDRRKAEENSDNGLVRRANQSFANVPGISRAQQIIYTCAEQASRRWINGETNNEFYNDLLLEAKHAGFVFDGVEYDGMISSGTSGLFTKLAREANNERI